MSMSNERNDLECLKEICKFYYEKTEDVWYQKIEKQVERKLNQKWNGK